VRKLREALQQYGVTFTPNASHITSVPVGDATRCREIASRLLQQQGVYLQPINHPTVPVGEECLRVITTSRHQPKHINHLALSLKKVLSKKSGAGKLYPSKSAS
jgi:5-aminolevulinate synthase